MFRVVILASCIALPLSSPLLAKCATVEADIVSLGEPAARFYAARSMAKKIEEEKGTFSSTGEEIGKVSEPVYDCKFFPNIIGMDEWRCTGSAKVCTK